MKLSGSNSLTDLAGRVRSAEKAMQAAAKEMGERTLQIGNLLIEAKATCAHGEWLPFLNEAGIAERQAQRYMALARSGLKSVTVTDLGLSEALAHASLRKLPVPGTALMAWVGNGLAPLLCPVAFRGETTAFVFDVAEYPGYLFVVAWNWDTSDLRFTMKPITRERPDMVFMFLDRLLGDRQADMQYDTLCNPADVSIPLGMLKLALNETIEDPTQWDTNSIAGAEPRLSR